MRSPPDTDRKSLSPQHDRRAVRRRAPFHRAAEPRDAPHGPDRGDDLRQLGGHRGQRRLHRQRADPVQVYGSGLTQSFLVAAVADSLDGFAVYSSKRFIEDQVHGVTGNGIGAYMIIPGVGYESSSGGPFFRYVSAPAHPTQY